MQMYLYIVQYMYILTMINYNSRFPLLILIFDFKSLSLNNMPVIICQVPL